MRLEYQPVLWATGKFITIWCKGLQMCEQLIETFYTISTKLWVPLPFVSHAKTNTVNQFMFTTVVERKSHCLIFGRLYCFTSCKLVILEQGWEFYTIFTRIPLTKSKISSTAQFWKNSYFMSSMSAARGKHRYALLQGTFLFILKYVWYCAYKPIAVMAKIPPPLGCALALAKGNLWLSSGPTVRHNCHGISISTHPSPVYTSFYERKRQ